MFLKEQIVSDLKVALKSGAQFKTGVLRLLIAALHNREIDKHSKGLGDALIDEEALQVLASEAKKRKESIEIFSKGERPDLAAKEEQELEIIKNYLPKQLNSEEVEKAVEEIIDRSGAKDFGQAMKAVMQELRGKADAQGVSELVKKKLGG